MERFFLKLRTGFRDFWLRLKILISQHKIAHVDYCDVATRFELKVETIDDVKKHLQVEIDDVEKRSQAKIDDLKKQIAKLEEKK